MGMFLTRITWMQYILSRILRGLKYIHSEKVFHRGSKPANILVNFDWSLKIADSGLARICTEAESLMEYVVTRWYRAPELLFICPTYDTAVDVWSVGCILLELYLGAPLLQGSDYVNQILLIIEVHLVTQFGMWLCCFWPFCLGGKEVT